MRPYLYFAAPLFSEAELSFNASLASSLERSFDVYLPQRDGCLVVDLVQKFAIPWSEASVEVFDRDVEAIQRCDVLLIVLDGRVPDEGAAFELGVAYSLGKTCWGLKTDPRQLLSFGSNPMLLGAIESLFESTSDLLTAARGWATTFSSESHGV